MNNKKTKNYLNDKNFVQKFRRVLDHIIENKIFLEFSTRQLLTGFCYHLYGDDLNGKLLSLTKDKNSTILDSVISDNNENLYDLNKLLYELKNEGIDCNDFELKYKFNEVKPKKRITRDQNIKRASNIFEEVENYLFENYEFRYNIVNNDLEYRIKDSEMFELLNLNDLYVEIQKKGYRFSKDNLKAILTTSKVKRFDPIQTYFENLPKWDKKTDYIDRLASYFNVTDPDRFKVHLKKMFVRCIACSLYRYINKHAFILVHSGQSSGKTFFCNWIIPKELNSYKATNLSSNKDGTISLCENFIINLDELASLSKHDLNQIKSTFTFSDVKVRPPYGDRAIPMQRRANFVGSTNNMEFLTDTTGNVRWLCFELTGKIDWNYSRDLDINMIWAQAYSLYHSGFRFELTNLEIDESEKINKVHMIQTIEMEIINQHISKGNDFYTPQEIFDKLNERTSFKYKISLREIGRALQNIDIKKTQKYFPDKKMSLGGYYIQFL